jgi:hypothetical protein
MEIAGKPLRNHGETAGKPHGNRRETAKKAAGKPHRNLIREKRSKDEFLGSRLIQKLEHQP